MECFRCCCGADRGVRTDDFPATRGFPAAKKFDDEVDVKAVDIELDELNWGEEWLGKVTTEGASENETDAEFFFVEGDDFRAEATAPTALVFDVFFQVWSKSPGASFWKARPSA